MQETTLISNLEVPQDFQRMAQEKLAELNQIHEQIERDQEEIDWLKAQTRQTLDRIKVLLEEM